MHARHTRKRIVQTLELKLSLLLSLFISFQVPIRHWCIGRWQESAGGGWEAKGGVWMLDDGSILNRIFGEMLQWE